MGTPHYAGGTGREQEDSARRQYLHLWYRSMDRRARQRRTAPIPDVLVRRYELVTVTGNEPKPEAPKRFFLGGQVYEDWTNVPEKYKVMDSLKTPQGTQIVPMFTFKW